MRDALPQPIGSVRGVRRTLLRWIVGFAHTPGDYSIGMRLFGDRSSRRAVPAVAGLSA
jgi:hypothetical protein